MLFFCLVAMLGFLFKDSFKSDEVLFANDGPLGVLKSNSFKLPDVFTGFWIDLNWLGMNGSSGPISITYLVLWLLGPIAFAKFYAPITLLLLGLSAWTFFRTIKLPPAMCIVAALAAALNMNFFSNTCWGLGTRSLTLATVFLALAALNARRVGNPWLRAALAGLAVGMGVIEGADNGVIFSLFVAAFVLFQAFVENETFASRIASSTRLAVVVGFAGLITVQVLIPLLGIATKGSSSITAPEAKDPQKDWAFATQWSLPPAESLRVIIPGLYGYRMDTPDGGEYWGRVGEAPGMAEAFRRSSGAGEYAGVLVVLVGVWALMQSCRSSGAGVPSALRSSAGGVIFTDLERKYIWFWAAMGLIALLFAWGRHAPFYHLIYPLPFFKSIRNPMKFMHVCHLTLMVLFGYGLLGLSRRYLETASETIKRPASLFEKRWAVGLIVAFIVSLVVFGIYASSRRSLVQHLMDIGFPQPETAGAIASFSIGEVGTFVLFLFISIVSLLLIQFGVFTGAKARWAAVLLGVVLVIDLARADVPWIRHYDYQAQYASNPIIDILKEKPWQQRVTVFPAGMMPNQQLQQLNQFYFGLWLQHHFQYYNIQSIDMAQEPRPPADKTAYLKAVSKSPTRYWELTNTRYILGLAQGFADALNQQLDPIQKRFRQHAAFGNGAQTNDTGPWALLEFTGALPRAKVYSQWQVTTTNDATLAKLADPAFDPAQTVLVSDEIAPPANPNTNANSAAGTAEFASYSPKQVELSVKSTSPSVLLLNDKFDPDWKVWVNGRPAKLLRCNFLMRGVQVPAGDSKVRFHFEPSLTGFKITLAAVLVGLFLCGLLFVIGPAKMEAEPTTGGPSISPSQPAPVAEKKGKSKAPKQ